MHDPIKNYDIKIIDMGWGNLEALKFFLLRLGGSVEIITISDYLAGETKKIIAVIPGIGSASDIAKLDQDILFKLKRRLENELISIGICLGMHLFCSKLEEADCAGLGIFNFKVERLKENSVYKSNIGYREVKLGTLGCNNVYFCHGFGINAIYKDLNKDEIISYKNAVSQNESYAAIIKKKNIIGLQFHPEKSGNIGLEFIKELINERIDTSNRML